MTSKVAYYVFWKWHEIAALYQLPICRLVAHLCVQTFYDSLLNTLPLDTEIHRRKEEQLGIRPNWHGLIWFGSIWKLLILLIVWVFEEHPEHFEYIWNHLNTSPSWEWCQWSVVMCLRSSNMLSAKGLVQAKHASATCPFFAGIFLLNPTYILNCNFKACRLTAYDPFRTFKIKLVWLSAQAKRTEDPEFPDSIRALWEKVVGGMLRGSAFCQGVVEPKHLIKFVFFLRNWVGWGS